MDEAEVAVHPIIKHLEQKYSELSELRNPSAPVRYTIEWDLPGGLRLAFEEDELDVIQRDPKLLKQVEHRIEEALGKRERPKRKKDWSYWSVDRAKLPEWHL